VHLNKVGPRRRRLCPPSSSARQPLVQQCSSSAPCTMRSHLNEGGSCPRRLCPPPSSARQPLVAVPRRAQCGSTRMKEDLAAATSTHYRAVLVSLSSSSISVLPCTMRIHGGGHSLCPPPGSACQVLVQQCRPRTLYPTKDTLAHSNAR
jgi:hypothetical protein